MSVETYAICDRCGVQQRPGEYGEVSLPPGWARIEMNWRADQAWGKSTMGDYCPECARKILDAMREQA
ncbi:MAG: hypothetical protein KGK07_16275 [Chloroflexota bacterium]|nr:hypothetical protein [Chloroflexota bacterium]